MWPRTTVYNVQSIKQKHSQTLSGSLWNRQFRLMQCGKDVDSQKEECEVYDLAPGRPYKYHQFEIFLKHLNVFTQLDILFQLDLFSSCFQVIYKYISLCFFLYAFYFPSLDFQSSDSNIILWNTFWEFCLLLYYQHQEKKRHLESK